MKLTDQELLRYSRQILIEDVGEEGQLKLKKAAVLIVGLGGLGSPLALYLAAAGVGRLGLIDSDKVDVSNLHRQVLYDESNLGQLKTSAAVENLKKLNPNIEFISHNERLDASNALSIFSKYDIIADGADNFATRYLVNDAAFFSQKTLVSASILGFEGQMSVFKPGGPCYRCLFPEPPPAGTVPSCAEAGVFGALPGIFGSLQAAEVIKTILGAGESLSGYMLSGNTLDMNWVKLKIFRNPECLLCGEKPEIKKLEEKNFICATDTKIKSISAVELKSKIKSFQVLDVREKFELDFCKLSYTHHIPMRELELRYNELSQETPIVVYCRSGVRSSRAAQFLKSKGFDIYNLSGGIMSWIETVDSKMRPY